MKYVLGRQIASKYAPYWGVFLFCLRFADPLSLVVHVCWLFNLSDSDFDCFKSIAGSTHIPGKMVKAFLQFKNHDQIWEMHASLKLAHVLAFNSSNCWQLLLGRLQLKSALTHSLTKISV